MVAVYTLMNIDRGVPEVWGSIYDVRDLLKATISMRDGRPLTEMKLGRDIDDLTQEERNDLYIGRDRLL